MICWYRGDTHQSCLWESKSVTMRKHTHTHRVHKWQHVLKHSCQEIQTDPSRHRYLEYALRVSHAVRHNTHSRKFSTVSQSQSWSIFLDYNLTARLNNSAISVSLWEPDSHWCHFSKCPPTPEVRKNSSGSRSDSGTATLCQTGASSEGALPMINSLHKPQLKEWQETFLPPTTKNS